MKPRCSERRNHGLTLLEVVVVVLILFILTAMILPASTHHHCQRIACINNLKEIDLAFKIWAGDHGGKYPMGVSATNGGAMESAATGEVTAVFQVMSNELSTPKILICPQDAIHTPATNFTIGFSAKKTSYFVGVDASEANPQMMLLGDDNFEIRGVPVKSGLLQISTNTPIAWSAARHGHAGNVALTDGSVQQVTTSGLREYSGLATNRIAIP